MTPPEITAFIKEKGIKLIDYKFCDLLGTWQHFSTTLTDYSEDLFTDGLGFDGSSIRGWRVIQASDMLAIPDPTTAWIDSFSAEPTLSFICTIQDTITREPYDRDPRGVAEKAEAYLKSTGIADTAYFGPEAEFFIFDDVRFDYNSNSSFHSIDSSEGIWNTAREEFPNLGYKLRHKEGYFPVSPADTLQDIRSEMCLVMEAAGVPIEKHHHEVGTAGQAEIDLRFDTLKKMGDYMMYYKYITKNVAKKYNKVVTFMPKPLFGDNGSGMHTHSSLWKDGKPILAGDKYAGLSEIGLFYIGGLLKHAQALTAFTNPTTNSYKRLVPGFEAPVNLAYSARNRSAAIRIPTYSPSPKAKRAEFRTPDPAANPYLAFSAMMLAGLDGIQNRIDPGDPLDKNLYELPPEELAKVPTVPASLPGAIEALRADHEFLLKGNVFNEDFMENWIAMKTRENDELSLRPHPYEFFMYFDV